ITGPATVPEAVVARLESELDEGERALLDNIQERNGRWFDAEMDKLEHWAEDRRASLRRQLDELEQQIRETRRAARQAPTLVDKLARQRQLRELEARRDQAELDFRAASRELDRQKEKLLDDIAQRINAASVREELFILHWQLH